jgi:hypothetical protein
LGRGVRGGAHEKTDAASKAKVRQVIDQNLASLSQIDGFMGAEPGFPDRRWRDPARAGGHRIRSPQASSGQRARRRQSAPTSRSLSRMRASGRSVTTARRHGRTG